MDILLKDLCCKVQVYWPLDDEWYRGCVIGYDLEANRHQVWISFLNLSLCMMCCKFDNLSFLICLPRKLFSSSNAANATYKTMFCSSIRFAFEGAIAD